jgi:hypothetical protein
MRYISKLCDEEVLEKVDSPNQSGNTPPRSVRLLKSDHQVDGKAFIYDEKWREHASYMFLHLLEPAANPNIIVIEKGVPTGEIEDVPLQYVIYKHIERSGVQGITSNVSK